MQKEYKWADHFSNKGVSVEKAVSEFEKISTVYGKITPEIVLNHSRKKSSVFYPIFEWDDHKAAEQWRKRQAMTLINAVEVTVISDGETRNVAVFEVVSRNDDRGYKSIETMDVHDIAYIKNETIRQIEYLKKKLKFFDKFDKVCPVFDDAIAAVKEL